jgi:hypothetical protein
MLHGKLKIKRDLPCKENNYKCIETKTDVKLTDVRITFAHSADLPGSVVRITGDLSENARQLRISHPGHHHTNLNGWLAANTPQTSGDLNPVIVV